MKRLVALAAAALLPMFASAASAQYAHRLSEESELGRGAADYGRDRGYDAGRRDYGRYDEPRRAYGVRHAYGYGRYRERGRSGRGYGYGYDYDSDYVGAPYDDRYDEYTGFMAPPAYGPEYGYGIYVHPSAYGGGRYFCGCLR